MAYLRFLLLLSSVLYIGAFELQENETSIMPRFSRMVDGDRPADYQSEMLCFLNWTVTGSEHPWREECAGILVQVGTRKILTTAAHCILPSTESAAIEWALALRHKPYSLYFVPVGTEARLEIRCGSKAAKRSAVILDGTALQRVVRIHKQWKNKRALALAMVMLDADQIRDIEENHKAKFWNDRSRFRNYDVPPVGQLCEFVSFGPRSAPPMGHADPSNPVLREIIAVKGEQKVVSPPSGAVWPPLFQKLITLESAQPRDRLSDAPRKYDCLPGDSGGSLYCGSKYFRSDFVRVLPLVGMLQQIPRSASTARISGLEVGSCLASPLHVREVWDDFFVESLAD